MEREAGKNLRGSMTPIPEHLEDYLTAAQLEALENIKQFGWTLSFVRRLFFEHPLVVVVQEDGKRYGVLQENGALSRDTPKLRESDISQQRARDAANNSVAR